MRVRIVVCGLVMLLGGPTARAQDSRARHGTWLRISMGYGSARFNSGGAAFSSLDGVYGYASVGGTVSHSVRLGAIVEGWSHSGAGNRATIEDGLMSIYVFPVANAALFLVGGFGFAAYQGDVTACVYSSEYDIGPGCGTGPDAEYGTPTRASGSAGGAAFTAGIGYDVPVARGVVITPIARYTRTRLGTSLTGDLGGLTVTQCRLPCPQKVWQVGVGVSYR